MKNYRSLGRLGVALLAATAIPTIAPALNPAFAQQPTFKVSVNFVDVDVTVTDAEGKFVTGLTPADFELFEDGKPQKIETFTYIELPVERQNRMLVAGRPVPADVRSNRAAESGRVYILLLDDLNVAPLRTSIVRKHARDFIERHLGPNDLAAVVVTSGRKDAAQEFTSDPALLLRAVDRFIGQRMQSAENQRIDDYYQSLALSGLDTRENTGKDPQDEAVVPNLLTRMQSFDPSNQERGQRAVGVLNTLRSLTEYLEGVRGRRKALLWFSEGIDYPMSEVFSSNSGTEITSATRDAINAAARANVNVFSLDPRGLIGMTTDFVDNMRAGAPDRMGTDPSRPVGTPYSGTQALLGEMRLTQDSLRTLAEGTGGFAAVDTNSFDQAYSRILDANSRYYLLGYVPPTHPRDGRFHRIEVKVKRPGLTAVARRGYPSPSEKTTAQRKQDALERWMRERRGGGADDTSSELRAALNNPVKQPGLTPAVQAAAFRGT
ncbi:MAG TPA: VWA domain-containing protein, partial [Vicinamibacterales bacterium]